MLTIYRTRQYIDWLRNLRDRKARARIANHFDKAVREGFMFGDVKLVGDGVAEVRFHFGPGYRVYFAQRGTEVVLLLVGGDKSSQGRDVAVAKAMAAEWRSDA